MSPAGVDNDFVLTASEPGAVMNGVTVILVHDADAAAAGPVVAYTDTDPENRALVITVENGVTTTALIVAAINTAEAVGTVPFTAVTAAGESGAGTVQDATVPYAAKGTGYVEVLATAGNIDMKAGATAAGTLYAQAQGDLIFSDATGRMEALAGMTLETGTGSIVNSASTR